MAWEGVGVGRPEDKRERNQEIILESEADCKRKMRDLGAVTGTKMKGKKAYAKGGGEKSKGRRE